MARKTYEIASLRNKVNSMIAHSHANACPKDGRIALFVLLESVLHDTGNYKGFQYLDGHEAVRRGEYDDTARKYH
jgi:hypothetical protein